jgi:hypothetical protein
MHYTLWIFVILCGLGVPVLGRKHTLPSVHDDWCAWLPREKAHVFDAYTQELERIYVMFSVALNEALEFRHACMLNKSYRAMSMTPTLCTRLANCLSALLRALCEHAKHYGTVPNTASLSPANFQSPKGQRTARVSDLLSRVLFTQRSQFLHKVGTLAEMAGDIGKDFRIAVENLSSGASEDSEADWHIVDAAHYDLNTCLREAIVLLKSFLLVLPEDQLGVFQQTVRSQMNVSEPGGFPDERPVRARRMASVGGQ